MKRIIAVSIIALIALLFHRYILHMLKVQMQNLQNNISI